MCLIETHLTHFSGRRCSGRGRYSAHAARRVCDIRGAAGSAGQPEAALPLLPNTGLHFANPRASSMRHGDADWRLSRTALIPV
jgi:hypothetical protein